MMSHRVRLMPYSSKSFLLFSFQALTFFLVTSFSAESIRVSVIVREGPIPGNVHIERRRTMRTLMVTK